MQSGNAGNRYHIYACDRSERGPKRHHFLVAMSKNTTSGAYFQRIHALDITTGAEEFSGPVTVSATFAPGPAFDPKQYRSGRVCFCSMAS